MPDHIDAGEEQIPRFVQYARPVRPGKRLSQFGLFLGKLVHCAGDIRPVEPGLGRLGLDFLRAHERRKAAVNMLHCLRNRSLPFFLPFYVIPVAQNRGADIRRNASEDMRMAAYELFADSVRHIVNVEPGCLRGDLGVKNDLQEKIPQLFLKQGVVLRVDPLDHFVRLLDQVFAQRTVGLFPVPRAAALSAQLDHDFNQVFKHILILFLERRVCLHFTLSISFFQVFSVFFLNWGGTLYLLLGAFL